MVGWIFLLLHCGLAFLTIALAFDERFAEGKVVFESDAWRIVLGAIGLLLGYRAGRGVVRTINWASVELGPDQLKNSRRWGRILQLIGAAFLLTGFNDWVADHTVGFLSWVRSVYIVGGFLLLLTGALSMIDMAAVRRRQRQALEAKKQISSHLSDE